MTPVTRFEESLRRQGALVIPWRISRGSLNPFREILSFLQVLRIYRREKPDLVHHFALKPVVYGGLAARLCGNIPSVNSLTGLGYAFATPSRRMAFLRPPLLKILRFVLLGRSAVAIFHNPADREALVKAFAVPVERAFLVRGSGVNLEEFSPQPEPSGVPVVMLASRLLWEKGVGEFVTAATRLREQGAKARFVLVGDPDPERPRASISTDQLRALNESGTVEWWGYRDDMAVALAQANLVCLPTHHEGLPKVLIEAAASGRAIVTTDIPGCRQIVKNGVNGLLTPVGDPTTLADAIRTLLDDPTRRAEMGKRGRELAIREFAEEMVVEQTLAIYRKLQPATSRFV
jgi:glycosyltransferase involved in cell wall biosynthesis